MTTKNTIFGTMHIIVKTLLILLAVVLIIYASKKAFQTGYNLMAGNETTQIVNVELEVPQGASTETIANILKENELIGNTWYFRIMSKLLGYDGSFQYGKYTLNTGMDEEEIMGILLTEGEKRETVSFTIPEGYTAEQIADKLAELGICEKQDFLDALESESFGYKFIDQIPDRNNKLQGYLFPDTYQVYKDASAEDIISTMLQRFDKVFIADYYTRAEELGYTVDQLITIASIIEREVKYPPEREDVASVIYNRLDIGMNLQMCSTIQYALGKPKERLLYDDLDIDSPYNTYLNPGLPIGPIACPGEASIKAALYPSETNYLYFVLVNDETGQHEFNETLEGHNKAKQEYGNKFYE